MNRDVDHCTHRLCLRANIIRDRVCGTARTTEISPTAVVIQTEATALIGEAVTVELSFPGLVEAFVLEGLVVDDRPSTDPNDAREWRIVFVFRRDEERMKLSALLGRVKATPTEPSRLPYRVLMVDDNKMTRDAYSFGASRYFEHTGSRVAVDVAQNADQAREMLSRDAYDLAIVDYYLPEPSGDSLISWMRNEPRTAAMAVVAVSMGGERARTATLAAGADFFLDKPVILRDLFSTLEKLTATSEAC